MVIYKGNDKINNVAITFDDGPNPEYTPKILKVLMDKGVKATFFLIGKNTEKYPDIARQIISEGHDIGNHTLTHLRLSDVLNDSTNTNDLQKAQEDILKEINGGADLIKVATGLSDSQLRYLRPPHLAWNTELQEVARPIYGDRIVMSDTCSEDWNWDWRNSWSNQEIIKAKTDEILNNVIKNVEPGSIIGLHDSSEKGLPEHGSQANWEKRAQPTFLALPRIIEHLQSKGLSIVKLSDMDLVEDPLANKS